MATEIASAYLSLYAKMPGVQNDIAKQLGSVDADKIGTDLGKKTSAGYTKGFAVAGAVGGLVATLAQSAAQSVGDLVGDAVAASDATQKFAQTLGFAGVDTTTIDNLQKSTKAYADSTVYDLATVQGTTAQLAANGVKDYDKLTEAAGNLNAVAGGNQDTFGSVAMMLTQTAGAGKLTTENWNQLADAIPGASGVMQDALEKAGAYTGNFRDAMAKGEITADEFNTALMELGNDPIAVEAAKSTETMEGALGSLQATITGGLAGAITKIKPMLTTAITFISGALGTFFTWFQSAFTGLYDLLVKGDFTGALTDAFGWQEDSGVVDFLLTARDAITGLYDLIVNGNFSGALRTAFGWEEDSGMVDVILTARDAVIDFATKIPERLGEAFAWVKANMDWIAPIAVGIGAAVLAFKLWTGAILLWQGITKVAAGVQLAFNVVMAANPVMLVVMAIAALVAGLIYFFSQTEIGREIWASFTQFLVEAWNNIVNVAMVVVNAIATAWNATWSGIGSFFSGIWEGVTTAVNAIGSVFQTAFDVISGIVTGAFEGVVSVIKGVINTIIDLVNGVIGGINDVAGVIGGAIGVDLEIGAIPKLADGGVVSRRPGGIVANIGEGRYDEAVVPLSPGVLSQLGGGSGGGIQQTNYFDHMDPEVAVEMAGQRLTSVARRARA
jgi:tape measure domain-containing protein